MLKPGIKRLCLFLIFLDLFLIKMNYTDADIFADRTVSRNRFTMINLDFSSRTSFNNNSITNLLQISGMQPGGFDLGAIKIKDESGRDFRYQLKTVKTNGDDFFCSQLNVKVLNRQFVQKFSGRLLDLSLKSDISKDEAEDLIFFLSFDSQDANLKNRICEFNFDFKTYRKAPDETGGIFAQRLVSNVVASGSW